MGRYVLEKLEWKNEVTGEEMWRPTVLSSDNPEALNNFLAANYRIFDKKLNWVHKTKNP